MKKICNYTAVAGCVLLLASGCCAQHNAVQNTRPFTTIGRVIETDSSTVRIFWPGTQVQTQFSGTAISALIKDESGRNHFAVIVDDSLYKNIPLKKGAHEYVLAEGLPHGQHRVSLYKLTDWFDGESELIQFIYPPAARQKAVVEKKKWKLEFYGNSITVGAGMFSKKDAANWPGSSTFNYYSYGAIAARKLDASAHFIASSGIGLMVSWGSLIMPEIYNRSNPADSNSSWNFDKYQPDVVIVNLLQNDQSLIGDKNNTQFIRRFGTEAPSADTIIGRYKDFISRIRAHHPNAYILCCLGSMSAVRPGSPFPDYIKTAVALLNDRRVGTHFFTPIKHNEHPTRQEHEAMAEELIPVLKKILSP